jgi:hypothetical protein
MAVNDSKSFGEVIEGISLIAEIICRHSIVEGLYLNEMSAATTELRRALVKLYAAVLVYLSKAKHYLQAHSASQNIFPNFRIMANEMDEQSVCSKVDFFMDRISLHTWTRSIKKKPMSAGAKILWRGMFSMEKIHNRLLLINEISRTITQ